MMYQGVHRKILVTLRSKSRSPEVKRSIKLIMAISTKSVIVRSHLSLYFFSEPINLKMSTFLAIKSLIVGAQKVITYRLKGNRITHAMGTINHHHYDDLIIQNGKN